MSVGASKTAQYMALFRALESQRRPGERLFEDPFARAFLSPRLRWVANLAYLGLLGEPLAWFIDWRWPGVRSSAVVRTRFIDDALQTAVQDGVRQVVVLGAGYDTRAQRLACLDRCRVFEVDRPATQRDKQQRLEAVIGARRSSHTTFVPLDFAREALRPALEQHGFDPWQSSFFVWEGVTNYLSAAAVDATLRAVASCQAGSQLLFTYVHRGVLDGSSEFTVAEALSRTLERAGERWTFGLYPAEISDYLTARGLELSDDVAVSTLRDGYFGPGRFHGYEFYRIAQARVRG
jgi:methyltransferase (TIGR00027 family)